MRLGGSLALPRAAPGERATPSTLASFTPSIFSPVASEWGSDASSLSAWWSGSRKRGCDRCSCGCWLRTLPANFYEVLGGQAVRVQPIEIGGSVLDEVAYGWPDTSVLISHPD